MLAKGGLDVHNPTSQTRFVLIYISYTGHSIALIFAVDLYLDGSMGSTKVVQKRCDQGML